MSLMRVVYDVSLFGLGYHGFKSGLFRVAENIARGLIESKQCDLTFCSTFVFKYMDKFVKILRSKSQFCSRTPFINQEIAQSSRVNFYNLIYKFTKSEKLFAWTYFSLYR